MFTLKDLNQIKSADASTRTWLKQVTKALTICFRSSLTVFKGRALDAFVQGMPLLASLLFSSGLISLGLVREGIGLNAMVILKSPMIIH